ncbi:hypothetical protein AGLY_014272 [Aphis glycines]|uniref:Uncharacterized protein n=1 Tax=Aphis glycines TaxID=307491 RepID=A0A6G0T4U9_APHGL|nr:hypothetical protein AGLY_014272 [Aphis glycines]
MHFYREEIDEEVVCVSTYLIDLNKEKWRKNVFYCLYNTIDEKIDKACRVHNIVIDHHYTANRFVFEIVGGVKKNIKELYRVQMVGEKGGLCFNGLNTPTFKITYEELCIKFSRIKKFYRHFKKKFSEKLKISVLLEGKLMENLVYEHKKFYDFSTSKLLANFRVFDRFPTIKTTHKEPCIKFSKLFGHPKIFHRHFKKNFSKKSKNFSDTTDINIW